MPGVVYAAGVRHAYNVAAGVPRARASRPQAVSGETPKRELAEILAAYERGEIDVLVNAQLLAEGWNSPRATVCMHLAPTASKRIYQQRVGRVTRRHPGKEAGVVVDFVHPATKHDDPVVTLHSLLDRDVYRGGAIVVGPVRRGRGRRVRVERRVIPVAAEEERRHEVFERELWRIAVEYLDWGEQHMWAALAGARVAPSGWRRARAMLHFDKSGELKRRFLLTARRAQPQLAAAHARAAGDRRRRATPTRSTARSTIVGDVAARRAARGRQGPAAGARRAAHRPARPGQRSGSGDLADMTREVHEEYAVQRWPETKRLLGLLVNSSGGAHARNARRLVHAARKQDRRLQRRDPRRRGRPHARGRWRSARRADAAGAQAERALARAAAQLPQAQVALPSPPPQGRRGSRGRGAAGRGCGGRAGARRRRQPDTVEVQASAVAVAARQGRSGCGCGCGRCDAGGRDGACGRRCRAPRGQGRGGAGGAVRAGGRQAEAGEGAAEEARARRPRGQARAEPEPETEAKPKRAPRKKPVKPTAAAAAAAAVEAAAKAASTQEPEPKPKSKRAPRKKPVKAESLDDAA